MEHASYLKHLHYDKKLSDSYLARYLRNPRLLILILLIIIVLGVYSYNSIPRRLNPEIKIPLVVVSTVLPGASATDMESLVTTPLENSIGGVANLKTYSSTSRDSVSVIQIEFNSGTDADKAASDVKTAVDGVALPKDANDPSVAKVDFEQFPVWTFSLANNKGDTASLITFSNELKNRLETLKSVDNVTVSGLEEQEIQIFIKPDVISTYGFSPQQIIAKLPSTLKAFPAGTLRTQDYSYTLSIEPSVKSIDDIRNTKITLGQETVNLSDIAVVAEKSKPSQGQSYVSENDKKANQSVSFSIYKTDTANINQTVEDSRVITEELLNNYEGEFTIFTTSDISDQIDKQFFELIRDFFFFFFFFFIAMLIFLCFWSSSFNSFLQV